MADLDKVLAAAHETKSYCQSLENMARDAKPYDEKERDTWHGLALMWCVFIKELADDR